jgi:hypothetical protein
MDDCASEVDGGSDPHGQIPRSLMRRTVIFSFSSFLLYFCTSVLLYFFCNILYVHQFILLQKLIGEFIGEHGIRQMPLSHLLQLHLHLYSGLGLTLERSNGVYIYLGISK